MTDAVEKVAVLLRLGRLERLTQLCIDRPLAFEAARLVFLLTQTLVVRNLAARGIAAPGF